jgi:hypothetical protein
VNSTIWILQQQIKDLQELQTNEFTFSRCDAISDLKQKIREVKEQTYLNCFTK